MERHVALLRQSLLTCKLTYMYTHPDKMTATNCYEAAVDADLYVALHLMQGWNIQ